MKRATLRSQGLLLAGLLSGLHGSAQAGYPAQPPLLLGAAWYPEQWPESQWEPDLARMEAAHIHLVRVGEFAWSTMEPREGEWHWEWLDRAIAAAGRHGIVVVLGTPSAAPPAWLTSAYPETLRVSESGARAEHGNRQQCSLSSDKYRALARDAAVRMAERYGHNPHVVGWQIDNELGAPSFDAATKAQFHAWLRQRLHDRQSVFQPHVSAACKRLPRRGRRGTQAPVGALE